ncbi:MAG TPA: FAD-dependent oxidoreductase [Neisseriales bacterium]|jgi:NADH dehydrogenase|nr:FAD-dependent oxidoreductase [Neisseriales bacterium]
MTTTAHRVVIIGGGFAGLSAAIALKDANVNVTLLDKRNFHLFQPLLYQIATGSLSESEIASPLRSVLARHKNVTVYKTEVRQIDLQQQLILTDTLQLEYDSLIVATGVTHNYYGNYQWAEHAPGLKSVEDALEIRQRIFMAFERAEKEADLERRKAQMRFVIIGSGPTGVELAGSLGELAHNTLKNDFRNIDPKHVEILLLEGFERILPSYSPKLSKIATGNLTKLGVKVLTNTKVIDIQKDHVAILADGIESQIATRTVLWAAGMQATPLTQNIATQAGVELDRMGRIAVNPDLSVPGFANLYVLGDIASCKTAAGNLLPGIAPVAKQQGSYIAGVIKNKLIGKLSSPFKYFDKGNMAVIGRNKAVAQIWKLEFSGYFAWIMWVFVHVWFLVGYDSKLGIMLRWAWNYWTDKRQARLITLENSKRDNSALAYKDKPR